MVMSRPGSISTLERARTMDALERETFDLLLIGGGITGAGIAHEATRRGLSVALLEAEDFAAGTSSRSSKLIHGGLRYLAMGDVALVRETALERKEIFRIAPHLAEPRWMVLPTRSRATLLKFQVAITTYEKLGAVDKHDVHQNWSRKELEREEPLLDRKRYPFACAYREYLTDDARLVLANLRGAVGRGAHVLNYARVEGLITEGQRAVGVRAVDSLSGRELRVRARALVNAAGPWVEAVRRFEDCDAPDWLHLSSGIHISLPRERLPLNHLVVMQAEDRRTVFAIPRGDVVYIGTTDKSYHGGPAVWPAIGAEDVRYLLEPVPRYFGTDAPRPDEIIGAWSGLRPLVAQPGKAPSELSRKDEVTIGPTGMVSIAGGKLTGYRPMAWGVLAVVAEVLGRELASPNENDVLPGGDFDGDLDRLAETVADAGAPLEAARPLARLYGTEASQVLALGSSPMATSPRLLEGEVDWAVREEGAVTVEDILYRRNRSAMWSPKLGAAAVEPVAARMAELLGWDTSECERQVASVRARLAADLDFGTSG
jgi:glycerol-3-phosphate dehydrogenase